MPKSRKHIWENSGLWGIENDAEKQREKKLSEERLQKIAGETEIKREEKRSILWKRRVPSSRLFDIFA